MSPSYFTTAPDSPYDVEIANVGTLAGNSNGGIPVEEAAETLRELQAPDGEPLSGKKLDDAARDFADDRGLRVRSAKSIDREKLRVEAGAFPAGKTIEEFSREAAERDYGQIEAAAESDAILTPEDAAAASAASNPATPPKEA